MKPRFELVAHRGFPQRYPENTIVGIEAAIAAGARHLEVDIQFSADHVPVIYHDQTLQRTSNQDGAVTDFECAELLKLPAGEKDRFGEQFEQTVIPTLAESVAALLPATEVHTFFEIKPSCFAGRSHETVVERVLREIAPLGSRATVISFDADALYVARQHTAIRCGWILDCFDAVHQKAAAELEPEFLFCDVDKLPNDDSPLWPGAWDWALYDVVDPRLVAPLVERGAQYVETMDIEAMLRSFPDAAPRG